MNVCAAQLARLNELKHWLILIYRKPEPSEGVKATALARENEVRRICGELSCTQPDFAAMGRPTWL